LTQVDTGYDATDILLGIEFEARAGEVQLVTGPTAAGKTSFLHMLRLALPPRTGQAIILGEDARALDAKSRARLKRRIGYLSENPNFVEQWSAFENIALPLRLAGRKAKDFVEDVRELVDFVGLGAAADQPAGQLSGAERRRAAIARALASKPDLILADDPTAGMSIEAGRRIVRLLSEMRRVGAGVVIASQDETLAEVMPCWQWRLELGRLTPVGHSEYENAEVYR
jgi:cell division transport system ATP-binding protein